jgi:predicted transcriptional regulator of viral defense system
MGNCSTKTALALFDAHQGTLHTKQALALGMHPRTLYRLRDTGKLVKVSRGIYRLASLPSLGQPDLVTVALRVPRGIVCLISALAYHDLTTEVPHEVHLALPRGTKTPRLDHPPLRIFRFSGSALTEGIQVVSIDGVPVRIYGPEKTVVDCFRFRNRLGLDLAIEALKGCIEHKGARPADILHYARLCHVAEVMRPYIEALQ